MVENGFEIIKVKTQTPQYGGVSITTNLQCKIKNQTMLIPCSSAMTTLTDYAGLHYKACVDRAVKAGQKRLNKNAGGKSSVARMLSAKEQSFYS